MRASTSPPKLFFYLTSGLLLERERRSGLYLWFIGSDLGCVLKQFHFCQRQLGNGSNYLCLAEAQRVLRERMESLIIEPLGFDRFQHVRHRRRFPFAPRAVASTVKAAAMVGDFAPAA